MVTAECFLPVRAANFRHAAALAIPGHQKGTPFSIDSGDTLPHGVGQIGIVFAGLMGVGMAVEQALKHFIATDWFGAEFPQVIAEMIFSNSPQPGRKRACRIEFPEASPCGEKGFLCQVFRLMFTAQPREQKGPYRPLVFQNQLGKRRQIPCAGFSKPISFIFWVYLGHIHDRLARIVRKWLV
jgi:hypothetical protein